MIKRYFAVFAALFLFAAGTFLVAQQAPKAATKPPQPKTQQEFDAYKKFVSEPDFAKKVAAGEQFEKDFPNSELTVPFVYPQMVVSYQQLNSYEKTVEFGEKILRADPSNTFALFMLAMVIPERVKDDDLDRQQKLDQTAGYARKLLELSPTLPKPEQFTDEQFKAQKAQLEGGAHSALGFVALHKKNYDEAIAEYKKSVELFSKDAISFYRLGMAYSFAKKDDEAIKVLATAVAMSGPPQAKSFLEQLYKAKNGGSLDGLDKVISQAAANVK